jgi:hypothetical protein
VNAISSVLNDAANSSPLGPWTGSSMDVAELEATAAVVTTIQGQNGVATTTVSTVGNQPLMAQQAPSVSLH